MKINDVCKAINITKKAVLYYEKKGLISPGKDSKGYRVFGQGEVGLLREISLYRRLGLSTKAIARLLKSDSKEELLKGFALQRAIDLEVLKDQHDLLMSLSKKRLDQGLIEETLASLVVRDQAPGRKISHAFRQAFPGAFGYFISLHYENFTFRQAEKDQGQALKKIIDYLDQVEDLDIPLVLEEVYQEMCQDRHTKGLMGHIKEAVVEGDQHGEALEAMRVEAHKQDKFLQAEAPEFFEAMGIFKEGLARLVGCQAYEDNVILPMVSLSADYEDYREKLKSLAKYKGEAVKGHCSIAYE